MQKHKFNIFPEMLPEDYGRLRDDLAVNGYDKSQPIWLFEGAIIDGWNRYKACNELSIQPVYKTFEGSTLEAFDFVMRTNKRRNLNSGQWAAIAVEAEEIVQQVKQAIETERKKAMSENYKNQYTKHDESGLGQLIAPSHLEQTAQSKDERKAAAKIAEMFNTNRTYISDAQKLKEESPELFEAVKTGEKTMTEVKAERKKAEFERKKAEADISERDKHLIELLNNGETIVVNQRTDLAAIRYAESKGLYVRADRFSDWGNPFEMGKDGTRAEVCENYKNHFLPFKPSLLKKIHELKGKALGCWCAPEQCHCDTLKQLANEGNLYSNC